MRVIAIALVGSGLTGWFVRIARRGAVRDRLRADERGRSLPPWLATPIAGAMHEAMLTGTPEQAVDVWLLGSFVAGVVGVIGFGAPGAGAAVAVFVATPCVLRGLRHRRRRRLAVAVPDTLEAIASELRAGGTVATALRSVAAAGGPLASDLGQVVARTELGAGLADAVRAWPQEREAPGVEAAASAIALCATIGGRSADALDGLASSLRARLDVLAEARALSSQARLSAIVIGAAPLAYLAFSCAVDPRSVQLLVATGVGRVCAVGGLALEALGAWWMRRIVNAGAVW